MQVTIDGQTALVYLRHNQKYVKTPQHEYVFVPQHGVSLAWIYNEDVDQILRIPGGCCGNTRPAFRLANPGDVALWEGKNVREAN